MIAMQLKYAITARQLRRWQWRYSTAETTEQGHRVSIKPLNRLSNKIHEQILKNAYFATRKATARYGSLFSTASG